jgi:hypothetical protein
MNDLPELTPNTHIVALLGISDPDPCEGDGWFLGYFCFLNRLLHDLSSSQQWLTCIDLDAEFGPIVHGTPFKERKIVYEENRDLSGINKVPRVDLQRVFLDNLRSTCRAVASRQEPLLLILIGHGEEGTFGLCIGEEGDNGASEMVLPQDVRIVLGEELSPESPVTVILSSRFSGGWLSTQQSVMAAVAAHQESDSYQRSGSGCVRSVLFTHAIANTLRTEATRDTPYKEFTEHVDSNLERLFALLLEINPPAYSAQTNAWNEHQQSLTGLRAHPYQERFEALSSLSANPVSGTSDRERGSRRQRPWSEAIQNVCRVRCRRLPLYSRADR